MKKLLLLTLIILFVYRVWGQKNVPDSFSHAEMIRVLETYPQHTDSTRVMWMFNHPGDSVTWSPTQIKINEWIVPFFIPDIIQEKEEYSRWYSSTKGYVKSPSVFTSVPEYGFWWIMLFVFIAMIATNSVILVLFRKKKQSAGILFGIVAILVLVNYDFLFRIKKDQYSAHFTISNDVNTYFTLMPLLILLLVSVVFYLFDYKKPKEVISPQKKSPKESQNKDSSSATE